MQASDAPVPAAGCVVLRGGDVLLIRRAKPPLEGQWSLPGGRIERGERAADAAVREVREETGCGIEIIGLIDVVERIDADSHFILIDYAAHWFSGAPRPGGDASEARFVPPDELAGLTLWDETRRIIDEARAMLAAKAPDKAAYGSTGR